MKPAQRGRPSRYGFEKLQKAGDTIFIPGKMAGDVSNIIAYWHHKTGATYRAYTHDDNGRRLRRNGVEGVVIKRED